MGCTCAVVQGEGGPVTLLNNLTYLKATSLACAKKYRKYGERYHKLPGNVRNNHVVPAAWQAYCSKAFVVSANDELPDLIQVFEMVEKKFEGARSSVFKGEVKMAKCQLYVAAKLVEEAQERVKNLRWTVEQYEWLAELHGKIDDSSAENDGKKEREEAWKVALPKCCGGEPAFTSKRERAR